MPRSNRVLVLGCGPAGMFAAHAVSRLGYQPAILSRKVMSRLGGAQYIHRPVPGLTEDLPISEVSIVRIGTKEGYARKLYGYAEAPTSWERRYDGVVSHQGWDIIEGYQKLWDMYHHLIIDGNVGVEEMMMIRDDMDAGYFDAVVSTIPRKVLCYRGHEFSRQPIKVAPIYRWYSPVDPSSSTIVYNGDDEGFLWYRSSRIFGRDMTEWPGDVEIIDDVPELMDVTKPLNHNCTCWKDDRRILFTGRYGAWHKNELSTDAFTRTTEFLSG